MRILLRLLTGFVALTGLGVVALYVILDAIARADDHDYFWE